MEAAARTMQCRAWRWAPCHAPCHAMRHARSRRREDRRRSRSPEKDRRRHLPSPASAPASPLPPPAAPCLSSAPSLPPLAVCQEPWAPDDLAPVSWALASYLPCRPRFGPTLCPSVPWRWRCRTYSASVPSLGPPGRERSDSAERDRRRSFVEPSPQAFTTGLYHRPSPQACIIDLYHRPAHLPGSYPSSPLGDVTAASLLTR